MTNFIPVAFADTETVSEGASTLPSEETHVTEAHSIQPAGGAAAETHAEVHQPEHASGGLSVDPAVVGIQAFNFLVLLLILNFILYKPLIKLLTEREKKIKDGVENAEKADISLREATSIREDMMKRTKVESQGLLDKARKEGETLKTSIVLDAQGQAKKIIDNGYLMVNAEKEKTMEELKAKAVSLIIQTSEKVLRQKLDSTQDAKLIEENLHTYSA